MHPKRGRSSPSHDISAWTCTMPKSVLLVDDNAVIRRILRQSLSSEPDLVVYGEAENGQEAIEMAKELRPDLIVMDLAMPVMNGLEAACILKGLIPTMPLIIFSEYSDALTQEEARSFGISAQVSKSVHIAP